MRNLNVHLKLIFIVLVSVVVFIAHSLYVTTGLLLLQLLLWWIAGLPIKKLKSLGKIKWFLFMILFFHSFFTLENDFVLFELFDWDCHISIAGLENGLLMAGNVLTMLAATLLVRQTSKQGDLIMGFQGLGLKKDHAIILDSVMSFTENERKLKKRGEGEIKSESDLSVKGLIKGKGEKIVRMINEQLEEARSKYKNNDLVVISTFTMIVTTIRFMKIAPGLPIAPGHKNILIIPFFILAGRMSNKRFPATNIGFISGIVHFLAGFGKYGPFGPLQFMVPGLVVDLLNPLFKKSNSVFVFGLIGLLAGASRVAAEISLALLVGMPLEYYLVYLPYIFSQCLFGMLSAPVTKYLHNKLWLNS